jgi:hypothetical protein
MNRIGGRYHIGQVSTVRAISGRRLVNRGLYCRSLYAGAANGVVFRFAL